MLLTKKLENKEKRELLQTLFGFDLINVDESENGEHWVVYDEDGEEFYGSDKNCQFDFSTLEGFFIYTAYVAKTRGYLDCQRAIREVLDI